MKGPVILSQEYTSTWMVAKKLVYNPDEGVSEDGFVVDWLQYDNGNVKWSEIAASARTGHGWFP